MRASRLLALVLLGACATSLSVRDGVIDSSALETMECIAVLPFENHSKDVRAGNLLAQEVAQALMTSEHYNVLAPTETAQILNLFTVPVGSHNNIVLAQKYGEVLGVQGVIVGAVTEYERRDLTSRTPIAEPVVGFVARMVETKTGNVVWTTATSNFDYQAAFAMPQAPKTILRQAVAASMTNLVDARQSVAGRGLCAAAYVSLEKGERPAVASIAEITRLIASDSAKEPKIALAAATTKPASGLPALPGALPALPSSGGLPALPGDGGGLPALPGDGGGLPALPDAGGGLPALPDAGGGAPALGAPDLPPVPDAGGAAAGGLPPPPPDDLPPVPGEGTAAAPPAEPAAPPPADDEPLAASPGKPPPALVGKLKGPVKGLATALYGSKPPMLPTMFQKKATQKPALTPKTKKSLDALGSILKLAPDMVVRLEVHTDLTGPGSGDPQMVELAEKQGEMIRGYLVSKHKVAFDNVKIKAMGRSKPVKPKLGAPQNNRVIVGVLKYPGDAPAAGELPLESAVPGGDAAAAPAPATAGSDAPAAASPGKPPPETKKLKGLAKTLAGQLYGKKPAMLPTDFPKKLSVAPAIFPKSKKSLEELAKVLRAVPSLRVRFEVYVDIAGGDAAKMQELASQQAQLIVDYLTSKAKIDPSRLATKAHGRTPKKSKVEITVLQY